MPLQVNGTSRGEVTVIVAGEDVLLPRTVFDGMKVPLEQARSRDVGGDVYISLASLSPHVTYSLDTNDLTLALTIEPTLLGENVLRVDRSAQGVDRGGDPSLFLNYAVNGQLRHTPSFFAEIGAQRGDQILYSGLSRTAEGSFLRGLTYFERDIPSAMKRWTIGDAYVGTDPLGGSLAIGGLTLSRVFSLQPYFVPSPAFDVRGTALTPSTVEVYVNGQLTTRIDVPPGGFTLHDLPVTSGLGNTRVVVRDAFGRQTIQESPFYYSTNVLQKGLSDYVFSVGGLRRDFTKSFSYDGAGGLFQYRRGITDALSLGGRAEASNSIASGGPRVTLSTRGGDFDMEYAVSRDSDRSGTAAAAYYRFTAPRYTFGASATSRSASYANLSLPAAADRALRDWNAFATLSLGRISAGLIASGTRMRSGEDTTRLALTGTAPLGRAASMFLSAGQATRSGRTFPELLVGLSFSVGGRTTANVLLQRTDGLDSAVVEVRRPLMMENGLGFALQSDSGHDTNYASVEYQTNYGHYEMNSDPRHAADSTYTIAGGIVGIGGRALFTRPLSQSFALARVGIPGVRVFAHNQEVGRTGSQGDLLITNLLGHYADSLHIADKDIPMDYAVDATDMAVVPPTRGGVIAKFPVRKIAAYTGKIVLMIVGEPAVPSLGEVQISNSDHPLVLSLGRDGEFYTEDLAAGTYGATLRVGQVRCQFDLVLPPATTLPTDVGVIRCTP